MREIFTYGTVGGAPGNRCFYPDISQVSYQIKAQFPANGSFTDIMSDRFPISQLLTPPETLTSQEESRSVHNVKEQKDFGWKCFVRNCCNLVMNDFLSYV
jgi:hypothetical protein